MKNRRAEKWFLVSEIVVLLLLAILPYLSHAAIPQTISYQGYLTNAVGVPVNGTVQVVFSIWDAAMNGNKLWEETHNVNVTRGVYNVILGEGTPANPLTLAFDVPYYLGVKVGADSEMAPRNPLSSVGYAFRAKTADTGLQGPPGPTGPQGPQGPAGVNVAAGQQCAQGTFVTGFDQLGNIICTKVPGIYVIGDTGPAGGKVFYVTDGGLHGLEAAPADQSIDAPWGCSGTLIAGADGTAVGTGRQNTADILAGCSESGIASRIASNYSLNGYDGWFLPSKDELNLLYQQKAVVGGFATDYYWSSTEYSSLSAWAQHFSSGSQNITNKGSTVRVRAVRAF